MIFFYFLSVLSTSVQSLTNSEVSRCYYIVNCGFTSDHIAIDSFKAHSVAGYMLYYRVFLISARADYFSSKKKFSENNRPKSDMPKSDTFGHALGR